MSAADVFDSPLEAAAFVRSKLPSELRQPRLAIVCGSGLGGLQDALSVFPRAEFPYASVPNFPVPTVEGHAGSLVFGMMGSESSPTPVMLFVGRVHFYEGHSMDTVTFATRMTRLLDIKIMILTNAAGGLNPDYNVGDIVMLQDHLFLAGLAGMSPLRGPNTDDFGVRFPPLSDAYDLDLRRDAHRAWSRLGPGKGERRFHEGVYAFVAGPTYETRAECRMLRSMGADVVGMSTVPEIIVARHCGIRILAFSLVTNSAILEAPLRGDDPTIQSMSRLELEAYLSKGRANHEEVIEAGKQAAVVMKDLVQKLIQILGIT